MSDLYTLPDLLLVAVVGGLAVASIALIWCRALPALRRGLPKGGAR